MGIKNGRVFRQRSVQLRQGTTSFHQRTSSVSHATRVSVLYFFFFEYHSFDSIHRVFIEVLAPLLTKLCYVYTLNTRVVFCFLSCRTPLVRLPNIAGKELDLYLLYKKVIALGGLAKVGVFLSSVFGFPYFPIVYCPEIVVISLQSSLRGILHFIKFKTIDILPEYREDFLENSVHFMTIFCIKISHSSTPCTKIQHLAMAI